MFSRENREGDGRTRMINLIDEHIQFEMGAHNKITCYTTKHLLDDNLIEPTKFHKVQPSTTVIPKPSSSPSSSSLFR